MSESLRKVDYFYVMVSNTAGQGAKIMNGLAAEGVNLLACSAFPSGRRVAIRHHPRGQREAETRGEEARDWHSRRRRPASSTRRRTSRAG